jgi:hypothetical protein
VEDAASLIAFRHKYGKTWIESSTGKADQHQATSLPPELSWEAGSFHLKSSPLTASEDEAASAMKIAAAASFSSTYVPGSASYSQEEQTRSKGSKSNRSMQGAISWQAQGGDTLLCNK